jgi:VCBS repeat-containing protein
VSIAFDPDSVISQQDSLGQLTITEEGFWTFTVDNDLIKFLAADEVLEQLFVVSTVTGLKQEITVQIKGLNDAPEVDDITRSVKQDDEAFVIDLLAESNATDIDGDVLSLVLESLSLIDTSVDAGGVIFDATTNSLRVNPAYYSDLGNDENITISYNFSVTDGFVEISRIAKVAIVGDAPPTVNIVINETTIDDVAIMKLGSSSVSFVFSEPVADFTSSDISLSLGSIANLRQDAANNQVWHADLNLTAADVAAWQFGQVAEIVIDVNRFTDINGNFNTVGAVANYLVIFDRNMIIDDAIAVIDNFIHPKSYYSDRNPNLLFEGTDGNDYIDAFTGDNIVYGLAGDDILVAAGGDDVFIGGSGDDLFIDSAGDDVYVGGSGNDILLLNLSGQQQDIFIGGAGFDRVVIPGSVHDYSLELASKERINFTNEYLTRSRFDLADVRDILEKLAESNVAPIDPFIELALVSYTADGLLSMAERLEFAANYGDAAATLLGDLSSFRGIKVKDIEGFDTALPVFELITKSDMPADEMSAYLANLLQAEMLIFDDATVHILDGVLITEAVGTEGADLFFLALPEQINQQSGSTYTLNDFALNNDSIVIEGLFLQDNNGDLIDVESDTLLDYLTLDETGLSGQIDLSAFVDSEGNTVTGEVIIKLVPVTDDNSAEAIDAIGASIYKADEDFAPAISGDF